MVSFLSSSQQIGNVACRSLSRLVAGVYFALAARLKITSLALRKLGMEFIILITSLIQIGS
jgi:hypothetical protein